MGLDMYLSRKSKPQDDEVEVAYWRKANAIHNWFVKNVQNGIDDCGYYEVTAEQLLKLLNVCKEVKQSLTDVPTFEKKIETGWSTLNGKKETLYDAINVFSSTDVAERLLPIAQGFFFGSSEYGESYVYNLDYSIKILDELLQEDNTSTYIYSSSW